MSVTGRYISLEVFPLGTHKVKPHEIASAGRPPGITEKPQQHLEMHLEQLVLAQNPVEGCEGTREDHQDSTALNWSLFSEIPPASTNFSREVQKFEMLNVLTDC